RNLLDNRSVLDRDTHRLRRAVNGAHRRLDIGGVEVGQFSFSNFKQLLPTKGRGAIVTRLARARTTDGLADEERRGWCLELNVESPVLEDRYHGRYDVAALRRGGCVVALLDLYE